MPSSFLRFVVASLTFAAALAPHAARAATVTVNTTTPNSSTDGLCGIIEAVTAVNQAATYRSCTYTPNGQSDRIVVPNGTHTLSTELRLLRPVEIVGASQSSTIINSGGVFIVRFSGANVGIPSLTLRTITLQRASTQSLPVTGVRVDSSGLPVYLTMDRVRVRNCNAPGVDLDGALVSADIYESVIENNSVGIKSDEATVGITNSTIASNRAGVDLRLTSNDQYALIVNATIRDNVSTGSGAGLKITATDAVDDDQPSVYINSSTFSGNQATGNGGAIYTNVGVDISGSVFSSNTATGNGGGLYLTAPSSRRQFFVATSAFRNNRAAKGAGIHLAGDGPTASLRIYQSSLTGNVATGDGGAIFTSGQIDQGHNLTIHDNRAARGGALFHELNGELHLFHLTVTQNRATQSGGGGGFRLSGGNHAFAFNILQENRAGSGFFPAINNLVTSDTEFFRASYCLIDSRTGATNAFPIPFEGGTNTVATANLGSLTTPSGQVTSVRRPLTGSLAIDAIPATGSGDPVTIDQLGYSRPFDGDFDGVIESDIGAIEVR